MSIRVKTEDAVALLTAIDEAIEDGTITEWSIDGDRDYCLKDEEGDNVGWLHPVIDSDSVVILNVIGVSEQEMSKEEYAQLHTDFVNMMLVNFDDKFDEATISALSDDGDDI